MRPGHSHRNQIKKYKKTQSLINLILKIEIKKEIIYKKKIDFNLY